MKLKFLFILLIAGIAITSCSKDDDDHGHNEITITFLSPANGEEIEAGIKTIEVEFSATASLHDIEIVLMLKETESVVLDLGAHLHVQNHILSETLDFSSFESGTTFILKAEAEIEHDGDDVVSDQIEFSIQ